MVSLDLLTSLCNCKINSKLWNQLFRELTSTLHARDEWLFTIFKRLLRLLETTETPSMPKYEIVQEAKNKQTLNNRVKLMKKAKKECGKFSQQVS